MTLKNGNKGVKFPCDQCDYRATKKCNLLTHINSIHRGFQLLCGQCDYKATQKGHLLTHVKSTHKMSCFPVNIVFIISKSTDAQG